MVNRVDVNKLWLECSKRDIQFEPLIQTALEQLRINPFDYKCLNIVQQRISSYDVRETLNPDSFKRTNPTNSFNGTITLGDVSNSEARWKISPHNLITHMIVVGRTGGGKSSLIKAILKQLLQGENK